MSNRWASKTWCQDIYFKFFSEKHWETCASSVSFRTFCASKRQQNNCVPKVRENHRCARGVAIFPLCYMLLPPPRGGQAKIFCYMSFFWPKYFCCYIYFPLFVHFFLRIKYCFNSKFKKVKLIPVFSHRRRAKFFCRLHKFGK